MNDPIGKYAPGTTVFAKVHPEVALVVRRFVAKIYYCQLADLPGQKDLVYFERELMDTMEKALSKVHVP